MIESPEKTRNRMLLPQYEVRMLLRIYDKPVANIILSAENLNAFLPK
jgi:hypothetical protein